MNFLKYSSVLQFSSTLQFCFYFGTVTDTAINNIMKID